MTGMWSMSNCHSTFVKYCLIFHLGKTWPSTASAKYSAVLWKPGFYELYLFRALTATKTPHNRPTELTIRLKCCSAMRSISRLITTSISKIALLGLKSSPKKFKKNKTTVSCDLWSGGIIGLDCSENWNSRRNDRKIIGQQHFIRLWLSPPYLGKCASENFRSFLRKIEQSNLNARWFMPTNQKQS